MAGNKKGEEGEWEGGVERVEEGGQGRGGRAEGGK